VTVSCLKEVVINSLFGVGVNTEVFLKIVQKECF
jgi:hypothetical protein